MAAPLRLRPALLAALLGAACAAPAAKPSPRIGLRVCVSEPRFVEAYAERFAGATAAEPRGGRECDVTARAPSALNAGKVVLRSAYDGSVLVEIEGGVELVPNLAALALAPGGGIYERVLAQRSASGFHR